jgi:hypothetical protein
MEIINYQQLRKLQDKIICLASPRTEEKRTSTVPVIALALVITTASRTFNIQGTLLYIRMMSQTRSIIFSRTNIVLVETGRGILSYGNAHC